MADLRPVVRSHTEAAWTAASDADVHVAAWRRRVVERLGRCGDPHAGFVWLGNPFSIT